MNKIKKILHNIEREWRWNDNFRIFTLVFIIILIVFLLSMTFVASQNRFLKYNFKSCFDRMPDVTDRDPQYNIYSIGNEIIVQYYFEQKCYSSMSVDYILTENNLKLFFEPKNMDATCVCYSEFKGVAGPVEPGVYNIEIHKMTDNVNYLVHSREIIVNYDN
ncbi:MAG: hypothetical protein ACMXYG_05255 [Candidatus Woesearchaeota archaeon]